MAKAKSNKYVYTWGNKKADGDGSMKPLLGGKGANLAEMTRIGLPVPPGFTITTEVCTYFYAHKKTYPKELQGQMEAGVANMEKIMGTKFGDHQGMPLLVAVRSGARDSMPGMMDTILNLGLNDQTVVALADATKNRAFRVGLLPPLHPDVWRRRPRRAEARRRRPRAVRNHHPRVQAREISQGHRGQRAHRRRSGRNSSSVSRRSSRIAPARCFRTSPWDQLRGAAGAVFGSWMNDRASVYRRKYNIPTEWGTAVNVQAMVFGNTGNDSGSGVAFTRNPANGTNEFYGEFLINAQGEDVVAGVRTPEPVLKLKDEMPKSYAELMAVRKTLESHFKDVQDIEFTDPERQAVHAPDAQRQAHRHGRPQVLAWTW
jgi:pyruvate,orthophosphate dikinase